METEQKTQNEKERNQQIPPKFNIPSQMNYGTVMDFKPLNGSQILRNVITDTYVTASENEDVMMEEIDKALDMLKPKTRGFAGYLSFFYLQMTMFYLMKKYDMCFSAIEKILHGLDSIEKYIYTGNYQNADGTHSGFVNYAFGESEEELKKTTKFLHDSWNTAKLIHYKAGSFESGFSLLVTSLMLHAYNKQLGMMREDCENIRELTEKIKKFIEDERDNPDNGNIEPSADVAFANIEDISKTIKEK